MKGYGGLSWREYEQGKRNYIVVTVMTAAVFDFRCLRDDAWSIETYYYII